MYEALPKNERTFHVDLEGDTTGVQYKGDFTVKCTLTISEKHSLGLERTRLLADYSNPTADLMGIAETLATLRTRIVDSPMWWKDSGTGSKLRDENVLVRLAEECDRVSREWREEVRKRSEESKKSSDKTTDESAPKGN